MNTNTFYNLDEVNKFQKRIQEEIEKWNCCIDK